MVIFHFVRKVPSSWRHPGQPESDIHFRFSVSRRARPISLEFRSFILAVCFGSLACHTGCTRWPAEQSEAGGGRGCAPLLITKYEPLLVGSDRVISAWSWDFSVFSKFGGLGETLFTQKRLLIFCLMSSIRAWVVDLWLYQILRLLFTGLGVMGNLAFYGT